MSSTMTLAARPAAVLATPVPGHEPSRLSWKHLPAGGKSMVPRAVRALCLMSVWLLAACPGPSPFGEAGGGGGWSIGGGNPAGNGDGGLWQPSDGGTFAAKPSCPSGAVCQGACPDGGTLCVGNCGFLASVRYPLNGNQMDLAVGDLQGDGFDDLVTADPASNTLDVLFNKTGGSFQTPVLWGANQPRSLVLAKLDANNSLDVLLSNAGNSQLGVYFNQGQGSFGPLSLTPAGASLGNLTTWVSGGFGKRFVAVLRGTTQDIAVLPVNANGVPESGTGSPDKVTAYPVPSSPSALVSADFDGDGDVDLAVGHSNLCTVTGDTQCQSVGVLLNKGDGTFDTQHLTAIPGSTPSGLVAAKLSPDALTDLVVADTRNNQVVVLYSRGDGTFLLQARYDTIRAPSRLAFIDINRDSLPDLAGC